MSVWSLVSKNASSVFNLFKKILLVMIVLYGVFGIFMYVMKKDQAKTPYDPFAHDRKVIYQKINDPELKKTDEGKLVVAIYRNTLCGLIGEGCTDNPADYVNHKSQSFSGKVSSFIATPYSVPPASGVGWVRSSIQDSGLAPAVHAAEGTGFSSLRGYMGIWKLFRNISFLLLVVLMLAIGFMIMFRVKLDAQTVISLESALPRIVITMILISFSFAIAGFIIDLMYLLIGISVDLIMGFGMGHDPATVLTHQNYYIGADFGALWPSGRTGWSFFGVGSSLWNLVPGEFKIILDTILVKYLAGFLVEADLQKWTGLIKAPENTGIMGLTFGANIGGLPNIVRFFLSLLATGLVISYLPGIILGLIIILTLLFLMFRLFFLLLGSYMKVILYVIFAPIIILFEAVPGQNSFNWWIKNVIGELIVFPTVVVMMLVGNAIIYVNSVGSAGEAWDRYAPLAGARFINPSQDTFLLPFLHGFRPEDFNIMVGLGIILLLPDFIKIVKGFVGVSESPLNLGIGTFLAGGSMLVGGAMGGLSSMTSLQHSLVGYTPGHGPLDMVAPGLAKRLRGDFDKKSKGVVTAMTPDPNQDTY
jgi:hypothetical protein